MVATTPYVINGLGATTCFLHSSGPFSISSLTQVMVEDYAMGLALVVVFVLEGYTMSFISAVVGVEIVMLY